MPNPTPNSSLPKSSNQAPFQQAPNISNYDINANDYVRLKLANVSGLKLSAIPWVKIESKKVMK